MPSIFSKIDPAACISLLCAAVSVAPAHAAVLTTSLSSTSVTTGQQFTLDVIVSGLDAGQAVAGFDLDLVFDPALLTADHATFGNAIAVSASYGASVDVAPATAVPEPSGVALLMAGALAPFVRRARTPSSRRPAR